MRTPTAKPDYEKLGAFYLGRYYDANRQETRDELALYDSRRLLTHGLIIGMTGSGKTGLGIGLIEEAAIDGIPAIVIDPKGDMANLLLGFPDLRAEDFAPWINPDDAQRKGLSAEAFAAQQAEQWRQGLAAWDQQGERIRRMQAAAEFAIYTPGSNAGLPISILKSFGAPPPEIARDFELLSERIASTVAGLLGLLGKEADPLQSRETILLSQLLQSAWMQGRDLDLGGLIHEVQNPTISRVGVMDVDTFFPAKERFALAMQLNNLLASPAFAAWLEGDPLDIKSLLYTPTGKPRIAVFSIAHLEDSERMFFVTLLLNELLSWMRAQSGTTSLRALLYMDEILGYFPPVANPPSKLPLLTLLKQARAFGLGVVLSTQNPVDLDYKGLSNMGTWFIGRLQTERDKARVLEGLEGASFSPGTRFDRAATERLLAGLGKRIFLLHSVYEEELELFETRWALSYMRGPLTRPQIQQLMRSGAGAQTPSPPAAPVHAPNPRLVPRAPQEPTRDQPDAAPQPVLPPEVPQYFVSLRKALATGTTLRYQPRLLGAAQVRFKDSKAKVDVTDEVHVLTEISDAPVPVDWAAGEEWAFDLQTLQKVSSPGDFVPCAAAASQVKNYAAWNRAFVQWIYTHRKLTLFRSNLLGQYSNPGESESDFRIRLAQAAREHRDGAAEKLRQKYAPKLAQLDERLRRAEAAREREADQAHQAKFGTLVSLGSTLLGAFLGRKAVSSRNMSRAASTMRGAGRAMQQASDVKRAEENIEAVRRQLADLDARFRAETDALEVQIDPATEPLETLELTPAKSNINVRLLALVWLPHSRDAMGIVTPVY